MFRRILIVLIAIWFVAGFLGCSSSDKFGAICDKIYTKITAACDIDDPAEAAIVAQAFSALYGETITVEDVQGATKASFKDECSGNFKEETAGLPGEAVDVLVDGYDQALDNITSTDCATAMTQIAALFPTL